MEKHLYQSTREIRPHMKMPAKNSKNHFTAKSALLLGDTMTSTSMMMRSTNSVSAMDYDVTRSEQYFKNRKVYAQFRPKSREREPDRTPGPSDYEVPQRLFTHGKIITSYTPVDDRMKRPNVAPNSYDNMHLPYIDKKIMQSIKSSDSQVNSYELMKLSPDTYNIALINDTKKGTPSYTMGHRTEIDKIDPYIPAGANYNVKVDYVMKTAKGRTFDKEPVRTPRSNGFPGPGAYNLENSGLSASGGFSFRSRTYGHTL